MSQVLLLFLLAFHLLLRIRSFPLHHAYDSSLLTLFPSPLRSRSSWSEDPRTMFVTPSQRRENQLPQGSGLEAWAPSSGGCKIPTTRESPSRSLNNFWRRCRGGKQLSFGSCCCFPCYYPFETVSWLQRRVGKERMASGLKMEKRVYVCLFLVVSSIDL